MKLFAAQLVRENPGVKSCYIALMENDGQYDLEVEVNEGTIGGTCRTEEKNLTRARRLADELDKELSALGWKVYFTREEWEEHSSDDLFPVQD